MTMLKECTQGPWHICPKDNWRIRSPLPKNKGNTIAECWTRDLEANAALIVAAYDLALCWWATHTGTWVFDPGVSSYEVFNSDEECGDIITLAADSFGFPVLTDDLRQELIREMNNAAD